MTTAWLKWKPRGHGHYEGYNLKNKLDYIVRTHICPNASKNHFQAMPAEEYDEDDVHEYVDSSKKLGVKKHINHYQIQNY